MLSKVVGHEAARASVKKANHAPVANTAAVITLAATPSYQHFIHGVQWSYSAAPTGGKLTITVAGSTVFEVDITASGPGGFNFGIPGGTNQAVVVTLAAGTGSIVGKVNAQYTTENANSL